MRPEAAESDAEDLRSLPRGTARAGRRWRRRLRTVLGIAILGLVLALVLRAPSATTQFVSAFRHFRVGRLPWLAAAAGLETASLAASALVQRRLLRAGQFSLAFPTLLALVVASTAVVDLVPAGVAAASGWIVEQYHFRGAPYPLAVWVVLASGFAAAVSGLALVLVGAGIAGIGSPIGLALSGLVLAIGASMFVLGAHRLAQWDRPLAGRLEGRLARAVTRTVERASQYRVSRRGGSAVLGYSTLNWLLDAGCLAVAFKLMGFPVPWRGLLFAYAASQMLGALSFLRIGVVEGGLVGGFVLTGTKAAPALTATLMYRIVSYWAVAGVGVVIFVVLSRRQRRAAAAP